MNTAPIVEPSFIQPRYNLFDSNRYALKVPLAVADDGIAPLSNNVAVPVASVRSSGRLLFQNRR